VLLAAERRVAPAVRDTLLTPRAPALVPSAVTRAKLSVPCTALTAALVS
jgi:hypothetical protein